MFITAMAITAMTTMITTIMGTGMGTDIIIMAMAILGTAMCRTISGGPS